MSAPQRSTLSLVCFFGGIFLGSCGPAGAFLSSLDVQTTAAETAFPTNTPSSPGLLPSRTPAPTSTTPACLAAGGETHDVTIPTAFIPRPLEYRIYLPPCYRENIQMRYPVLYLIHGQNFSLDQWDRLGADDVVDDLVEAGEIAPFIIVMPRERIWQEPPDDQFGVSFLTELVPWIDENYRTLPERGFRAIGGLSRGAAWAVHIGLQHWEMFGAIGAHSPALFWVDVPRIPGWLEAIPPGSQPRIFVDVGRRDYHQIRSSAEWFGDILEEKGIPHEWYSYAGRHDEVYWHSHVEQYIRFYALGW